MAPLFMHFWRSMDDGIGYLPSEYHISVSSRHAICDFKTLENFQRLDGYENIDSSIIVSRKYA